MGKVSLLPIIGALALHCTLVHGFFDEHDAVLELTEESFPLPDNSVYIVKFYGPQCSNCKKVAPEFVKLAEALSGTGITVAACDAKKYPALGKQFGISSLPGIRIFAGDKAAVSYNGLKTAPAMAEAVLKEQQAHVLSKLGVTKSEKPKASKQEKKKKAEPAVVEITDSTFDQVVMDSSEMWMVEFYAPWCGHCKNLAPHWQEAAEHFQGTGIKYGAVDATANEALAARFGVQGFPTIKMFPPGQDKTDSGAVPYEYERTAKVLIEWSEMQFEQHGGVVEVEIAELVSQEVFDSTCMEKKRCALGFLPDLRDTGKAGREAYIEVLKQAQMKARHVPIVWLSQGQQPELEKLYQLEFGFPAFVYLRTAEDKEVGFVHRGKFDAGSLSAFVSAGKSMNKAVGDVWPSIQEVEPWEFCEPTPLEEDDDDFDLEAFLNED